MCGCWVGGVTAQKITDPAGQHRVGGRQQAPSSKWWSAVGELKARGLSHVRRHQQRLEQGRCETSASVFKARQEMSSVWRGLWAYTCPGFSEGLFSRV